LRTWFIPAAAALAILLAIPVPEAVAMSGNARQAQELYDRATGLLQRNTIDTRRLALGDLEQATMLDPTNAEYQLTLARAYYQCGFLKSARRRFERVVKLTPSDAQGRYGLGQVWRRDWLKYLDRTSLTRSVEQFSMAARLKPSSCDAWVMLVPLLMEQDDVKSAAAAAYRAVMADTGRGDALLALAYTSYQLGQVARAESSFAMAIPRLPLNVRACFDDISPVATERDTMILHHLPGPQQEEFVRRFWKDIDPDLATTVNEAQLEYWSRVAHAYFLFYSQKRREWDERGEVYVRYGPPKGIAYNPIGWSLYGWGGTPRNVLLWNYPDLGMTVVLEDRLLSEYYLLPITRDYDPDPRPDPSSVARLDGALVTREGRGVFHKLPPGVAPLPLDVAIARFPNRGGARLLAQMESPGGPADSLRAEWVVLDSTWREVARGTRALSPSACEATERRVADFAVDLPPGDYRVGLTVRDGEGRRGVFSSDAHVLKVDPALALSDVVISCGVPDLSPGPDGAPIVRIAPNPAARVLGNDALTAYFEISNLSPDKDGQGRFEYFYTVKSAEKDSRIWLKRMFAPREKPPPISASREEQNPGSIRRQFVTVPVQSLPPGRYELEIRVHDLIADDEVRSTAEFTKPGVGAALRN
jgi:GWxTD domain-containing protein